MNLQGSTYMLKKELRAVPKLQPRINPVHVPGYACLQMTNQQQKILISFSFNKLNSLDYEYDVIDTKCR